MMDNLSQTYAELLDGVSITKVILVDKTFPQAKVEITEFDRAGIVAETHAADVGNAEIFAMNDKPVEMEVAPTHGDLQCVMQVGNGLVATQQQAPPDCRANLP